MHDFTLKQMETGIQHIIDKLEQATVVMREKPNAKPVGVSSQQTNQQNRKLSQGCSYCSGNHFSNECTRYKTVSAKKDRVMALKLCFNCLRPGHSSKMCHSHRTCRTCGLHHHSSLCIKASSSNPSNHESLNPSTSSNASSTVVSQGKSNQSSNSNSSSNRSSSTTSWAQSHSHKPTVTQHKSNASQPNSSIKSSNQFPVIDTTYVTSVNSTNFQNNVLPTATVNVRYCDEQVNVRAVFDTGSHHNFISPDVVKNLGLRVIKQVLVNLSKFGSDTESCMLDLVKVKVV